MNNAANVGSYISGFEELMPPRDTSELVRSAARGQRYGISSSHQLATEAGTAMFHRGGNAVDAGVAAGIVLGVVEPHMCQFGGIAPMMVLPSGAETPVVIDGIGTWPSGISLEEYLDRFGGDMPIGVERSVVPGAPAAWLTALEEYGTLTVADVLEPAIEFCYEGVFVTRGLAGFGAAFHDRVRRWPSTAAVFAPKGVPLREGDVVRQRELGSLFETLIAAEEGARGAGLDRRSGVEAARLEFYTGSIAREIEDFMKEMGGTLTAADLGRFSVSLEAPLSTTYRGQTIYSAGPWSQGPMLPMILNILEGFDLGRDGLTEAEYLHVFLESFKLVGADREAYFADPRMVEVPMDGLLSKEYAAQRRSLIEERAASELPAPGSPWPWSVLDARTIPTGPLHRVGGRPPDTSHVCAADIDGNLFSALPSDHIFGSPLLPGRGLLVSHRGGQFWLDPDHPSALAVGKRPRVTPNPAMMAVDGTRPVVAFGSPGEDLQCQAMAQFVRNVVDRGSPLQEAVEAPRVASSALPSSFFPHAHGRPRAAVERRMDPDVETSLRERGHDVRGIQGYSYGTGAVSAVSLSHPGMVEAVSDPRRGESSAMGK